MPTIISLVLVNDQLNLNYVMKSYEVLVVDNRNQQGAHTDTAHTHTHTQTQLTHTHTHTH